MGSSTLSPVFELTRSIWRRRKEITEVSVLGYATIGLTFVIQVGIVRLLGPGQFGVYSMALALVALVEVPLIVRGSELSLRIIGMRVTSGQSGVVRALAREMIVHDLRLYGVAFALLVAFAWASHDLLGVDPVLVTILAFVIPAQAGFGVFKSYFVIFNKIGESVRYEFAYAALLGLLNMVGALMAGAYGLAVSLVIAMLVKSYMARASTRTFVPASSASAGADASPMLTGEGSLSVLRNVFSNALNQVDVLVLGAFQRPELVAVYKVGKSLASIPIKVGMPAWRFLQPRLLDAVHSGNRRREAAIIVAGSFVLAATLIVVAPVAYLVGEPFLAWVYGEQYRGAFAPFLVLLVGVWAFHGVGGWFKFWVVVEPSRKLGVWFYGMALVVVIVGALAIGRTSAMAMAYVAAGTMILMCLLSYPLALARK
jgi:O-antigen/teichoic acid export membrane protein